MIRFWLDRGTAGLRVDVAHGLFKDPDLPDVLAGSPLNAPSPYRHRPELHDLYRSWREILDSYPAEGFPGTRPAIGEVWYDAPATLRPYLEPGGLPRSSTSSSSWRAGRRPRSATRSTGARADQRIPRSVGDRQPRRGPGREPVPARPRVHARDRGRTDSRRRPERRNGARRARAAALLLFALPGSGYIYQGDELGLPEVTDIPARARQDPAFH